MDKGKATGVSILFIFLQGFFVGEMARCRGRWQH
jgi:hypothetical protein